MLKYFLFILLLSSSLFLSGCLKDIESPASSLSIDNTAIMLENLEYTGTFITNEPCPILINAEELFYSSDRYTIFDFRPQNEYNLGHIKNAVNMTSPKLLSYLSQNNIAQSSNIVCVDANGQSSAYYAALLRLFGYNNAFSLNFGMASWNPAFAGCWNDAVKSNVWVGMNFTDSAYSKNDFTPLPAVDFPATANSPQAKTRYRISELLNIGFVDTLNYFSDSMAFHNYVFCYGNTGLYFSGSRSAYPDQGHPVNTPLYIPGRDLYPAYALQTIPSNFPSIIYCCNGQLSAAALAYLRTLGYNVRTLLYGAEFLCHDRIAGERSIIQYIFTPTVIKNYPVEK